MDKFNTISAFATLIFFIVFQAGAQQADSKSFEFGQPSGAFTTGFGAVSSKTLYDSSFKTSFVPYLRYKANDVTIGVAEGVSYQFLSNYNFSASVAIKPRFAPYDDGDTTALRGMKRNSSFDLSVKTELDVVRGTSVLLGESTEFTGEHGGQEFDLALRQFIHGLGTPFFITAGVKHQNEKLASFLYGVQASEQLSNRPSYNPRSVFMAFISTNAMYSVTERISLFGNAGLTFYPTKLLDSPIINEHTSFNLVGGVAFTF